MKLIHDAMNVRYARELVGDDVFDRGVQSGRIRLHGNLVSRAEVDAWRTEDERNAPIARRAMEAAAATAERERIRADERAAELRERICAEERAADRREQDPRAAARRAVDSFYNRSRT